MKSLNFPSYTLLLLTVYVVCNIGLGVYNDYIFDSKFIGGITLVSVCCTLYFLHVRFGRYALLLTLILGLIHIIQFGAVSFTVGLHYSASIDMSVSMNLVAALFMVMYLAENRAIIAKWYKRHFVPNREEKIFEKRLQIEAFQKRFDSLSTRKLQTMAENGVVENAKIAIDNILDERLSSQE